MAEQPDGAIVIGIDLATATARCVALDAWTGAMLASVSTSLAEPVRSPGGQSTQEPGYAATALGLVARVVSSLGASAKRIRAISTSGTSGTVVPLDAQGHPVAPARLYDDTSAADLAAAQGLPGGSMLARMAASLRSAQEHGHQVARLASTADVVHAALVGRPVAGDTSHFLKAGIDPTGLTWSRPMSSLGLDDVVPPLVPPGTVLGVVSLGCASRLGLRADVVVVAGMTDGCTAQIATGAVHLRDSVGVLGTTLVLKSVTPTEVTSPDGTVYSHRAPDGAWWPGGASNVGGGAFAAYRSGVSSRELAVLDMRAATRGPATVVCYPLARSGERFPVADPSLQPLWSG
ncbi:MAG: carbohydrate kinase, partial [Actinomycetota bacterium]|nr:carbohydrate kinase [Actinomycetota bacterium]